jgi:hypothetical protein
LIIAYGIVATLPTATEDALTADRYALGPEWIIGFKVSPVVKNGLVEWFE